MEGRYVRQKNPDTMNAYSTISVHREIYDEKLCFKTYARLFRHYSLKAGLLICEEKKKLQHPEPKKAFRSRCCYKSLWKRKTNHMNGIECFHPCLPAGRQRGFQTGERKVQGVERYHFRLQMFSMEVL